MFITDDEPVHSYVININPENRQPNETTLLYKAMKQYLENLANQKGKPIEYKLLSTNPAMIQWADSMGNKIFNWQSTDVIPSDPYPPLHVYETTIGTEQSDKN